MLGPTSYCCLRHKQRLTEILQKVFYSFVQKTQLSNYVYLRQSSVLCNKANASEGNLLGLGAARPRSPPCTNSLPAQVEASVSAGHHGRTQTKPPPSSISLFCHTLLVLFAAKPNYEKDKCRSTYLQHKVDSVPK